MGNLLFRSVNLPSEFDLGHPLLVGKGQYNHTQFELQLRR